VQPSDESEGDSGINTIHERHVSTDHAHVKKTAHENCEKTRYFKRDIMRFATETRLVLVRGLELVHVVSSGSRMAARAARQRERRPFAVASRCNFNCG